MSELKVTVQHGQQRVEFDSPGSEGNPEISSEFGGFFDVVTKPAKAVAKTVGKTAKRAMKEAHAVERFATTAARAAGHSAHTLSRFSNKVTGAVEVAARQVPVVGKPLAVVVGMANEPVKFADAVASGKRIDKAALSSLRRQVESTIELAPYAQLVSASIPGVGTGVAAAIAAGAALAEGRTINDAAVAAARAAIPGGAAAQVAFDASVGIASGKSVQDAAVSAAISGVTKTPADRAKVVAALEIAGSASRGKPLSKTAMTAVVSSLDPETRTELEAKIGKPGAHSEAYDVLVKGLPPHVRRAIVSGVAVGHAKERQRDMHAAVTSPKAVAALIAVGRETITKSGVLRTAQGDVPDADSFALGVGLMRHGGVLPPTVLYLRDSLQKDRQRVSFDAALALQVGAVTSPAFAGKTTDKHKVGYYAVTGSLCSSLEQRQAITKLLAKKNAEALAGAATAIKHVRARRTWWRRLMTWLRKGRKKG